MKPLIFAIALAVTTFAGVTYWALEWDGVATIRTSDSAGKVRSTRVWYVVAADGAIHVEAGTARSPWLADVGENPEVRFHSADASGRYSATLLDNPGGHQRIRAALRSKYGLRDAWVGLLVDTTDSRMVVLEPAD